MRVLAAMSGGVDSAVAAARAVACGHEVVGVHLALSAKPGTLRTGSRGCCTVEDAHDARRAADLLDRAVGLGFDAVCTGHYARLSVVDGTPALRRSADAVKDQSYVLASLRADQLRHAMFPLGDSTKPQVRAEAAERGLAVAEKPDSHDICFIPDGDTRSFLTGKLGVRTGALVDDSTGEVLAEHDGVHGFTVGQRHGLGIDAPAADGRPRYVLSLEPVSGTVRVGSADQLSVSTIDASRPVVHVEWDGLVECTAQVR